MTSDDNTIGRNVAEIVGNAARGSGVRTARSKGRTISLTFGSSEVRDRSDGQFPVEVWRCILMQDDTREDRLKATVTKSSRLNAVTRKAGVGWRPGSKRQWVEVRTPEARKAVSDAK